MALTQTLKKVVTLGAALFLICGRTHAQSADALIDKLVQKGILSTQEANELREETEKNFSQAYAVKSGMPDWVSALKMNGDARVRYEGLYSDASYFAPGSTNRTRFRDRSRFRYRLRFGVTASLFDNLEAGFRLTSADTVGGFSNNSGNPLSGNTTWQDNGSKKFVYFDTAYLRWTPMNGPDWYATFTLGKMDNPLQYDETIFDFDYTPEGVGLNLAYRINDQHQLKFNGAAFILDELEASSDDPYLLAAQLRWEAMWNQQWSSSLGVSVLDIQRPDKLLNAAVPNANRGNTRTATGGLAYEFHPFQVDGSLTYTFASAPLYQGAFPIKLGGQYVNNSGAPSSADNYSWNAGLVLGKSGKRGTWEISYNYRWLGANSWWEELVDDDFGAFYGTTNSPPNSGVNIGNGSGVNVKGHVVKVGYSPTDSLTLPLKYYRTELIRAFPPATDTDMNRIQVDAVLKF